ncbi:MAG: AraC family transcriptional regulator [Oceanipulchritudo sp.]
MAPHPPFPSRLPEPASYYMGVDAPARIRTRNAVIFLRNSRSSLQQRNFANRVHHRHVLIMVLETAGRVSLDGELHPLKPGNALLVLPYQFHHYIDLESNDLRWLFVTFELENKTDPIKDLTHRILTPRPEDFELWSQMLPLWERGHEVLAASELLAVLDQLLTRLMASAKLPIRHFGEFKRKGSWISRVESLIKESVMDGSSLAEVAAKVGLSERHLRTRFEAGMGVSIRRYKANFQLHRAASLMQQPELTLSRIAELSGFHSQAVFNRFIRRETGLTPSAWRKSLFHHELVPGKK